MEIDILLMTIMIGLGFSVCGFYYGRNYWMFRGSEACLKTLIENNYVKYHMINNKPELINLDKYVRMD